jgi:apolipoprotein N-acyltransferase
MISVSLSILSAVVLAVSSSSFNLGLFAWFGLIPLFLALENTSLPRAFFTAYLYFEL